MYFLIFQPEDTLTVIYQALPWTETASCFRNLPPPPPPPLYENYTKRYFDVKHLKSFE